MSDLRALRAKRQQQKPKGLQGLVQERQSKRSNGTGPKPVGLATLRAAKQAQRKSNSLAEMRNQRRAERKSSSKLDRTFDGLRYYDVRVIEEFPHPWGKISIANGNKKFTLHNRYGSWLAELGENRLAEPAAVARALGTSMTQLAIGTILQDRWYAALKLHGIPTPEERIRQREEAERATRRRGRKKTVDNTEET